MLKVFKIINGINATFLNFRLILSDKARNLKKGCGFHMDVLCLTGFNMIAGFLGGPWVAAASVRTISHLSALTVMDKNIAPGEKPRVAEVKGMIRAELVSFIQF